PRGRRFDGENRCSRRGGATLAPSPAGVRGREGPGRRDDRLLVRSLLRPISRRSPPPYAAGRHDRARRAFLAGRLRLPGRVPARAAPGRPGGPRKRGGVRCSLRLSGNAERVGDADPGRGPLSTVTFPTALFRVLAGALATGVVGWALARFVTEGFSRQEKAAWSVALALPHRPESCGRASPASSFWPPRPGSSSSSRRLPNRCGRPTTWRCGG